MKWYLRIPHERDMTMGCVNGSWEMVAGMRTSNLASTSNVEDSIRDS